MPLNITIIGLDRIGASLGLALGTLDQEALPTGRPVITGWDSNGRALKAARGRLAIDREARDLADAVAEADVIFVSALPAELAATFDSIARHAKAGVIVSDTGSAKTQALALAQGHLPTTVDFIGGHPIIRAVTPKPNEPSIDLFKRAIYCLTPGPTARPAAIDGLALLVEAIGAKPYYIDAAEHDAYIASVQQIPLIVSAALMETLNRSGGWREMQAIAGDALSTITQLTADDPDASSADCASNAAALESRLNDLIRVLVEIRDRLDQPEALTEMFSHAREMHEQWQAAQPNMRPGENEFYGQQEAGRSSMGLGALFFGQRRKRPDKGNKG